MPIKQQDIRTPEYLDCLCEHLDTPAGKRKNHQIDEICALLESNDSFKDDHMRRQIAQKMTKQRFTHQEVLCYQGDEADCFFVLLKGTCAVYVDSNMNDHDNRRQSTHAGRRAGGKAGARAGARATMVRGGANNNRSRATVKQMQFHSGGEEPSRASIKPNMHRRPSIMAQVLAEVQES